MAKLRFPGLSPLAARWLVDHRRIRAVGIDTASIDHGPSTHFGSHVILCGGNVPIFENVADLAGLPEQGAFVVALADEDRQRQRRSAADRGPASRRQ